MRAPLLVAVVGLLSLGCERTRGCEGDTCGTLVFATASEPDLLLPPSAVSALSRDVHDQIFLKLADIGMSLNTVGDVDFQPQLAQRWEWEDGLTLVFHLDPRARWHDGSPVSAADVAFTFDAYTDPQVTSSAPLRYIASVTARDSATAVFKFKRRYPEAFFDAVFHMRVLPRHHLSEIPRDQWSTAPFGRAPVGNGPYRFVEWRPGQALELVADSTFFLGRPRIRRLIWSFGPDINAAVNRLISGEVDAFEFLGFGPNVERVRAAPQLQVYPYLGATYAYVGFNLRAAGDTTRPHPVFGDREVRRALTMAVDRERMARGVLGDMAEVPNGPVSPAMAGIWAAAPPALAFDTAQASRLLEARGWRDTDGDGVRDRGGQPLAFRLLVNQSPIRGQFAQVLQEQLRLVGVAVTIDQVENNLMAERARAGLFDALIQAWLTDPSPAASVPQTWTRAGFGQQNYGRYANPAFEQALERASVTVGTPAEVNAAWRAALEIINADAPAIWLFAPKSNAAVHRRVADVRIRPDSWWALVWTWRIPPDRQIDRDRVEP
jgi:peptide/nickel transport system substrate-binding protein